MLERIQQFIDTLNISVRAFEQSISASNGLVRKAMANKTDIQSKWISAIVDNYPQLNIDWLITGRGDMLKSEKEPPLAIKTESNNGIPLIPIDAMAGFSKGEVPVMEHECERYIVPMFKGADFLIPVKGSSMIPKYNSGDIVACKALPLKDIFFQWNKVYALDTIQGALVKRVRKGSDGDHILIVSDNPQYEPFELHISQIYAVSLVIGVIRLE
jgi:phage repressor protein C with HTH and peptisase S24 domain